MKQERRNRRRLFVWFAVIAFLVVGGAAAGMQSVTPTPKALTLGSGSATIDPSVTTPTITSSPGSATTSTSATFTFTSPQTHVTFTCQLDNTTPAACTSPKSYVGLTVTTHTFRVVANRNGGTSAAATRTWTIDQTSPPASTFTTTPSAVSRATAPSFGFTDAEAGVTYVCQVDAKPSASCASPDKIGPLADGTHTFTVRAKDAAGNLSGPATFTWRVDTVPPPEPVITQKPPAQTPSTSNLFTWTDSEAGVGFQCSLENGAWTPCSSPYTVTVSGTGQHQFAVRAVDAAGNTSEPASWKYKVVASSGTPFQISGSVNGLTLGVWKPINVVLTNPNSVPITVTALSVTVSADSTPSGCSSAANVQLTQSNVSATVTVVVPAHGSVTLPAQGAVAPQIRLQNLATNQDVCKGKTFGLSYTGSAHS